MAGATRRLPPWMHGDTTAEAATSSNRADVDSFGVKRRLASEACQPKAKKQMRRTMKRREKEMLGIRSGARRNFAKKTMSGGKDSDETKHDALGGAVGECVRRKKRKVKGDGEGLEMESRAGQDEEDLTVEDLVSIAQEYVRAEEVTKQKSVQSEPISESADASVERTTMDGLGRCGEGRGEKEEWGSRRRSGDGTEVMLGLLLGPLVKKL